MKKYIRTLLFAGLFFPSCLAFSQESLTLSTYYAAPFGSYSQLQLVPQPGEPACDPDHIGLMFMNNAGEVRLCTTLAGNADWTTVNSPWTRGTGIHATHVYLINSETDPSYRVGIGTKFPEFKLSMEHDGGILALGNDDLALGNLNGSGAPLITADAGTRLIWYPRKSAFLVGTVSGDQWNDGKISNFTFIGGGKDNSVLSSLSSVIVGGETNTIQNVAANGSDRSAIIGGTTNDLRGNDNAGIFAGNANRITGALGDANAVVVGGHDNVSHGNNAAVVGGNNNKAGTNDVVLGGSRNEAFDTTGSSGILAGTANHINHSVNAYGDSTDDSAIVAGKDNEILAGTQSVIIGGTGHELIGASSMIAAGSNHNLLYSDDSATIAGLANKITGRMATHNTNSAVIGGASNEIKNHLDINDNPIPSSNSLILGGEENILSGNNSVIAGGEANIMAAHNSFIAAGNNNHAFADNSFVMGQFNSTTAPNTFVGGKNMNLVDAASNTFLWGHSQNPVEIQTSDAFIIYSGNVGIGTAGPVPYKLYVNGPIGGKFDGNNAGELKLEYKSGPNAGYYAKYAP